MLKSSLLVLGLISYGSMAFAQSEYSQDCGQEKKQFVKDCIDAQTSATTKNNVSSAWAQANARKSASTVLNVNAANDLGVKMLANIGDAREACSFAKRQLRTACDEAEKRSDGVQNAEDLKQRIRDNREVGTSIIDGRMESLQGSSTQILDYMPEASNVSRGISSSN